MDLSRVSNIVWGVVFMWWTWWQTLLHFEVSRTTFCIIKSLVLQKYFNFVWMDALSQTTVMIMLDTLQTRMLWMDGMEAWSFVTFQTVAFFSFAFCYQIHIFCWCTMRLKIYNWNSRAPPEGLRMLQTFSVWTWWCRIFHSVSCCCYRQSSLRIIQYFAI